MSRKGYFLENAPMESFFSLLKTEMVHRTKFHTRREAKAALFEYIEIFYNRQRRHSSIGYRTPAQARMDMMPKRRPNPTSPSSGIWGQGQSQPDPSEEPAMTTAPPPARQRFIPRGRATALPPSYTTTGDTTERLPSHQQFRLTA